MKTLSFLILFGSAGACMAEEASPFTPPLRLEQSAPTPIPTQFLRETLPFRLELPIGPVRIDYGTPVRKDPFPGVKEKWGRLA
jgi:hypothetical protein